MTLEPARSDERPSPIDAPVAGGSKPEPLALAEDRATPLGRFVWALLGAGAATVVGLSLWLTPNPSGFGTHRQLGLPPCEFGAMTGIPCPGCGLTTSFAHTAHGHFIAGFAAHLMGPPLFLVTLFVALYAPIAIAKRKPLLSLLDAKPTAPVLLITSTLGMLTWILRATHVLPPR
ncbi:MAG: DUF2752 domain-containing protein [Myxococcales bacterium]|nr:DUF2752 domain-containing protein [Myxococcales bacterium]